MSELRIALIAEGRTDMVLVEAALKAVLPDPFVMTLIQPEATQPQLGEGWGGVLRWCHSSVLRGEGVLDDDPTLNHFYDMFIVHLDADVADKSYRDYGETIANLAVANQWGMLPCSLECPDAQNTVDRLHAVLLSWLNITVTSKKTVICIPSKAIESWLVAAVLPDGDPGLKNLECRLDLENVLAQQPKKRRVKKSRADYLLHAPTIQRLWPQVRLLCTQADAFDQAVKAAL